MVYDEKKLREKTESAEQKLAEADNRAWQTPRMQCLMISKITEAPAPVCTGSNCPT